MHCFIPMCLFLCWMLPVDSKKVQINIFPKQDDKQPIKLSMVENAVDDIYYGCNKRTEDVVNEKFFMEENINEFAMLWKKANTCAEKRLGKKVPNQRLTKNHRQAICLYTSDYEYKGQKFYQYFNNQVRTMRTQYHNFFKFKSLHFWLTSAIHILRHDKCIITYRRTAEVFTGKVSQIIRFGFFASSSFKPDMVRFGKETCFKITTCSGAPLENYANLGDKEEEVLIPPHELFNITDISNKKKPEGLFDCKNVYILKSVGIQSNLNCQAIK